MALGSDIAGVVSGLLNSGGNGSPDLSKLFATIRASGEQERDLIKALPGDLQKQYADYKAANAGAAADLTTGTDAITDRLRKETEANYGPEATRAALDAVKGDIYADLPGQQDAIRQALAATGGFDRGTAGKQLAAPVLQAASKYASAAANITADQLKAKQTATQQAINTVASMDANTLSETFGLSKDQAMQILQGNRQDLKDQLTSLVNQSRNETSQIIGLQGDQAMNQYREGVADKAQRDALTNGFVNVGADIISGAGSGFMSGLDINSPGANYSPNVAPNQYASLGY